MTDDKIKEEFEKWAVNPYSEAECNFAFTETRKDELKASYYAGFRTAERLAKIEVLEEAKKICREHVSSVAVLERIDMAISKLKAAN